MKRADLARELDIHPRTLLKWFRDGCPDADRRTVEAWRDARDRQTRDRRAALEAARARKELAQAIEAEQRVAIRAGRLIPVDEVDRVWSSQVAALRARLLSMPTALADRLCRIAATGGAAGIEAALETAIHEALRELSGSTDAKPSSAKPRTKRRKPN